MTEWREIWLLLAAWGIVAVVGVLVCGIIWICLPGNRQRLLPPVRRRFVPWIGIDVWMTLCVFVFVQVFVGGLAVTVNTIRARTAGVSIDEAAQEQFLILWLPLLSLPLQLVLILAGLRQIRGAELYQLGLTGYRFGQNVVLGYLACLALAPLTYSVSLALRSLEIPFERHMLERVALGPLWPGEWILWLIGPLIAAPLVEELVFRGVLLSWLVNVPSRVHLGFFGGTVLVALGLRYLKDGLALHPGPALFVLAMFPFWLVAVYLDMRLQRRVSVNSHGSVDSAMTDNTASADPISRPEPAPSQGWHASLKQKIITLLHAPIPAAGNVHQAIYSSALLFAIFHSGVWPHPIPLFFLALGLGWTAWRTQSLVAPMVLHLLFNVIGTLGVILNYAAGEP